MEEEVPTAKKGSKVGRMVRIVFRTLLIIILLVSVIVLSVLTPPVQNFIRKKATGWLSGKLNTRVEIGKIYIGFPKKIILEGIYIEDKQQDTLLYGGKLQVDISMLKLLHNEVEVSRIDLSDLTAKVKRLLPDTIYNFQFIIDAFASKKPQEVAADSSSMKISVKNVALNRIRLLYKDDVTGNDVTLGLTHFDTQIDVFDLENKHFEVPQSNIRGLTAAVYQHKPLLPSPPVVADTSAVAGIPFRFGFKRFNLDDVRVNYGNDVSLVYARLNLGILVIDANQVDLQKQTISLDEIQLNNTTAGVRIGKQETVKTAAANMDTAASANPQGGWRVLVKKLELNNNTIIFDNDNIPALKQGMDYMHLAVNKLTLHADNLLYSTDSMSASITKGEMSEKSGFVLNTFQTDFLYTSNQAYLHNLLIETPGTTLRRSASLTYTSLDALKKNIGMLKLDIDLRDSRIQVKDLLSFAPFLSKQPAFSNPSAIWLLNGKITGSVQELNIRQLQLKAFSNTNLDIRGTISGLPDPKKLKGNLVINNFSTSRRDIELLAPKGSLPKKITLPETMDLRGTISGSLAAAKAALTLNSTLGGLSVNGSISNTTDKSKAKYQATLVARELNLGRILQNDSMYGKLSATVTAAGYGFDPKTADAKINGSIASVMLNRYNYKNTKISGQIARQLASFALDIKDPNINITMNGKANFSDSFPAVALHAVIDSIRTLPLHFTTDSLVYKGTVAADFSNTDPKNLTGELLVSNSSLTINDKTYLPDTIALSSGASDSGQFVRLKSEAINFALTGTYNLTQLGSVFQNAIQPYYSISTPSPVATPDTLDNYDFYFNASVTDAPLLKAFVPTLTRLDPVHLQAHFVKDNGFQTSLDAPLIIMGANRIQKLNIRAATANNAIQFKTDLEQFNAGTSMIIYATSIDASIADNNIDFLVNLKDLNNKNKYRFGGLFEQPEQGKYSLSLNPDSLMLNYDKWTIANTNSIRLNNGDINISNFVIGKNGQQLSLNSTSSENNSPLEVKFSNFKIGTITAFAKQDSLLADGSINGQVLIKDIIKQPVFTSDLTITNLMFRTDTVGNLAVKVNNTVANTYNADITLTGNGNEAAIKGDYKVLPENQSVIDLNMDIRKLQMSAIEAFSFGSISKTTGFLNGKFGIKGTFDKPDVGGKLNFNQVGFSPTMLGSYFTIDQKAISVTRQGIVFNSFSILDSAKNELILDGTAYTTNFVNYKLDLALSATNFQALNSTKVNSKLFYGRFFFNTDLHIRGTEASPVVDGDLTVNENTRLTVVMPQNDPGVEEREGIVRFIDIDSLKIDTTLLLVADSLSKSDLTGMDISVNIEINKAAELTLIVDEANGDFLRMKGTAELTGGIDPSGKTTLTGTYTIDEGAYNLSFNFIKRQFKIKQGSKITWLGEPTNANVDLTAVYVANTSPLTLVENQSSTSDATLKQKLPFEVNLILSGQLLKPLVTFDVILPSKNYNVGAGVVDRVEARLADLREQPDQLNKQVFALLLLNRFVAENPFASSGAGGFNAATAARQSVSKLLSDQLNNLASDLIKGVDLNFDLASNEDYSTGQRENRTDLNVSLSKQLLNDRLKVTVGSNFELEGPQSSNQRSNNLAGNVALDYVLSKDGRYLVRAYRKNEYEGELDGYIIETGLNFIIRFDYDKLKELFHSPKQKIRKQRLREDKDAPEETDTRKAGPVTTPATNE